MHLYFDSLSTLATISALVFLFFLIVFFCKIDPEIPIEKMFSIRNQVGQKLHHKQFIFLFHKNIDFPSGHLQIKMRYARQLDDLVPFLVAY